MEASHLLFPGTLLFLPAGFSLHLFLLHMLLKILDWNSKDLLYGFKMAAVKLLLAVLSKNEGLLLENANKRNF